MSASVSGSALPGTNPASGSSLPLSEGMDVERAWLHQSGCSQRVIDMLLKSRKHSTNRTYSRSWHQFRGFVTQRVIVATSPEVIHMPDFLEHGLVFVLSANTSYSEVAAISAFFWGSMGSEFSNQPVL